MWTVSSFKKFCCVKFIFTHFYACLHSLYFYLLERLLNLVSLIKYFSVCQFIQASFVVRSFHLWENWFDWVEFGTVPDIENWLDIESLIHKFYLFMTMNCKLVHEQSNWNLAFSLEFLQIFDEVLMVDRFVMNKYCFNSFFWRTRSNCSIKTLIDLLLIYRNVFVLFAPASSQKRSFREADFIQKDDFATFCFSFLEFTDDFWLVDIKVLPLTQRHHLFLSNFFYLNPMFMI